MRTICSRARWELSRACLSGSHSAWVIGAAVLRLLADLTNIDFVYRVCAFLPAIGLLAVLLPEISPAESRARTQIGRRLSRHSPRCLGGGRIGRPWHDPRQIFAED